MNYIYLILPTLILLLDRITKYMALGLKAPYIQNKFLYFELYFNRGISWGLFSSDSSLPFILVSTIIILITIAFGIYAYVRYKNNYNILPELILISGAISNIMDRFYYGGVIDFIILHINNLTWPAFNIADMAIVLSVLFMVFFAKE